MNSLCAAFQEYFRIVHADSPGLLHEVFRLRYQIYCQETQLADRALFPEQLERDAYDSRSTHILLQHRPSGHYVGTVRLVLPDGSDTLKPFPIEELAQFDDGFAAVSGELRCHVAEISRFAILHHFPHHEPRGTLIHRERRRVPRYSKAAAAKKIKAHLRFPHPMLALVVGMMRVSVENHITHWYAVMAPGLDRLLRHFSLHLQVVGPAFDHHGERRPHFDSITNVMDNAYLHHSDVWELVTDGGKLWPEPSRPTENPLASSA